MTNCKSNHANCDELLVSFGFSLSLSLSQQFQQLLKYVANVLEERGDMLLSTETSDL